MGKKFLIVCGGTGGHLSPGIAVAEELLSRGHQCALVISNKQVDSRLVQRYQHLDFVKVPGVAFGKSPAEIARFFLGFFRGLLAGSGIIRREKPDVVLAFGGFLSLGIVLFASLGGIPIALHEANRKAGRAVRLLKRFATRIYLPTGVRLSRVSVGTVRYYGYPVRKEFRRTPRRWAREKLGLPRDGFLLVVFGGSQGASALNGWVDSHCKEVLSEGMDIYCVRGLGKGAEGVLEEIDSRGQTRRYESVGFCDSMHLVLSAADLAISRAGAGSIAEMARCVIPSVLIPFPYASDNHQMENARYFEAQGGCIVLDQAYLENLFDEVVSIYRNPDFLDRMRENLIMIEDANRKEDLVADLEQVAADGPNQSWWRFWQKKPAPEGEAL
ncbi:UDP-N-acetylglucosamine--N-acetylmuramyl-(pentapeptide) pyrophosphoryl-undecaprenol N-acetylglucosamine transferase [Puniceicoccus vermicola]|uniref:UDP-N-acetylglucosamine--N-acetylmuramyl-(pentapeptide) pyrophosphoryl-undecaprenol N-acetylglucosamine transferase n=1 Tax=Puniceicoccus vermicola TaxID=388746 RepID=A0A7X1B1M5_9BACT|nr:UDP-N-acetylglucosamine--N-acetylmuramyl-(pentapeptide) pyrophosphoryl-undecaprenol N-acetylglucosamine transferase [Puniceicoccus vermicola]MBC2603986.1 UDP-N-acetylglucosamine--N-acetylmuramyl-(pentapeptide) pyrophosphoryl-undecaprenol N-acetylglucosamine transferase [Puniceicoccus vermicola]